jgi:nucleoside-diphosphate-sugar epimerase
MSEAKKILVTGAGGYIGRHVVKTLLDMGAEVLAADIYTDLIDDRATLINQDIFSGDKDIFLKLGSPDVCLHMAWKDGFIHYSDAHMTHLSKHYEFVKNMLDGGLKHIAVMGTMHEIGYYEGAIDENTPCNPISMYGIAKDALRRSLMLLVDKKEITFQWLRAFYIYGDDKRNHSIFAKLIAAQEEGKKTFPFTTGKNKYDFIHVEELARLISLCVLQDKINGIINCCSGVPVSLAEKVESFIKEHGNKIKLEYGAYPDRPYDSPAIWGDNTKINQIIYSMHN